ncbi:unnamed protein product [Pleuronectes platessa]|uniref:Uncharacterized protein n=1 Tax=Pleuronectes platessa TaxID=8262 RepID=A0A9N7Z0K9_PLEPL|nr:unnamed protein product [Pleuronectes platessa]
MASPAPVTDRYPLLGPPQQEGPGEPDPQTLGPAAHSDKMSPLMETGASGKLTHQRSGHSSPGYVTGSEARSNFHKRNSFLPPALYWHYVTVQGNRLRTHEVKGIVWMPGSAPAAIPLIYSHYKHKYGSLPE